MPDAPDRRWDDAKSLLELIEREGADAIAAFFCEPIIGARRHLPAARGVSHRVRDICREHDILFVVDEVVTGFGASADRGFASTRFGLEQDMITTAKGLTSGYVPMVRCSSRRRWPNPSSAVACGGGTVTRTAGHAGAAAAAMANLDIVERENLLAESKRLESSLHEHLAPLAEHPRVAEVRSGLGAVAAVQFGRSRRGAAVREKPCARTESRAARPVRARCSSRRRSS